MSPSKTPPTLDSNASWNPSQRNNTISNPPLTAGLSTLQQTHPSLSLGLRSSYPGEALSSTHPSGYQLVHPTFLPNSFQPVPKVCERGQVVNQSIQTPHTTINPYLNQPLSSQSSFNSLSYISQSDHLLLNQFQLPNQFSFLLGPTNPFSGLNLLPARSLENIRNESNHLNDLIQQNYVRTLTQPSFPTVFTTESSTTSQHETSQLNQPSPPLLQNAAIGDATELREQSSSSPMEDEELERPKKTIIERKCTVPNIVIPPQPAVRSSSEVQDESKTKNKKTEDDFVMGEISTENYYPTHFLRGSMIRLANGSLRKVEDLSTDDFLSAAAKTNEFLIEPAQFIRSMRTNNNVQITFNINSNNSEKTIEVQLEYPLFVLGKGWCSVEPERTLETYGLDARLLKPGDVCITMVQKEKELPPIGAVVTISKAHEINQRKKLLAHWRDELEDSMSEVYSECMRYRRASAPSRLERICPKTTHPASFEMYEI